MPRLVLTRSKPSIGRLFACALVAGFLFAATEARAGITATTGAVNVRTAPTGTLSDGSLESDTNIEVWFESRVTSPGAQAMDHRGAGLVNSTVIGNLPNPGTVTPGDALSYLIHIDQTTDAAAINYSGSITFGATILGVWFSTSTGTGLPGSDAQWKSAGMTFGTLTTRDWELFPLGGTRDFTISGDLRTLTLNQQNLPNEVDQIRVLINPEPSTGVLAALGVLGLAGLVRRRRRRARSATA